jgi:predicted lactoylglutathione lyase
MPNIKSIFHINVNVTNFERSLKFYEMLGEAGFVCMTDPDGTVIELIQG